VNWLYRSEDIQRVIIYGYFVAYLDRRPGRQSSIASSFKVRNSVDNSTVVLTATLLD